MQLGDVCFPLEHYITVPRASSPFRDSKVNLPIKSHRKKRLTKDAETKEHNRTSKIGESVFCFSIPKVAIRYRYFTFKL